MEAGPLHAPVGPLVLLGTGLYLAWFGVHYWRSDVKWPTGPVKSVLRGQGLPADTVTTAPVHARLVSDVQSLQPDSGASPGNGTAAGLATLAGPVTGSRIGDDALQYQGQGYVWGGPADKPGDWDCSSFVSYVLGRDLGMTLPGGGKYGDPGYPPHAHGPTTLQYLLYGTPVSYGKEKPGDLLVTSEHMGICLGGGTMISAQDPQLGTGVGGYQTGFPGGTPHVRRA